MRIRVAMAEVMALAGIGASQSKRSVWDEVFTADQATRGQVRYKQLCGSCHGEMLEGGESSPPLAGGEFLSNWNTLTVGDLFDRTRSTLPQSKPRNLCPEAAAAGPAYLLTF